MRQAVLGAGVFVVIFGMLWRSKLGELPPRWRRRADAAEIVVLALAVGFVAIHAYRNVVTPGAWDFPVFYTVARNAAEGMSFYDPQALLATFTAIVQEWNIPPDWLEEFGFWYAPPTVLFLAPLGFFSFPTALVLNQLVQGAFFAGSVLLLHRSFPLRPGVMGVVDMALLGLLFRPVISAFDLSQIVFGALLFLVVATGSVTDRPGIGGIALGIGALFKHLLLIPAVLVLALRRWRMTAASVVSMAIAAVVAGMVFGFGAYREFTSFGPGDRPPHLALDPVIQSLNGVLRRVLDAVPSEPGALDAILWAPYLVAAGLLTVATVAVAWRANRAEWATVPAFALVTLLALIVYPNTLYNTLPLMIPAVAIVIHRSDDLSLPPWVPVVFVAGIHGGLAAQLVPGFVALTATWLLLGGALAVGLRRRDRTVAA